MSYIDDPARLNIQANIGIIVVKHYRNTDGLMLLANRLNIPTGKNMVGIAILMKGCENAKTKTKSRSAHS